MLLNIDKMLEDAPEVEPNKFSRSDTLNVKGFASPYMFAEQPSCLCKNKRWSLNQVGEVCNTCKEKVMYNKGFGKMTINNYYILNPTIYNMINSTKFFNSEEINFSYMHMNDADDMFEYLIEKIKLLTNKEKLITFLISLKDNGEEEAVFMNSIPIIHLKHRKDGKGMQSDLNKYYGALLKTVDSFNNSNLLDVSAHLVLHGLQLQLGKINTHMLDVNVLRRDMAPSLSMSARCPILPQDVNLPFTGVTIGFEIFKRIYKYRIIHYLSVGKSLKEALLDFDSFSFGCSNFVDIVEKIKSEAILLIGRNPSLTMRSLIGVRLNGVDNTYTMKIPQIIFKFISGDNDGDTMSIVPIFTQGAREAVKRTLMIETAIGDITDYTQKTVSGLALGYNKIGSRILEEEYADGKSKNI